MSGEQKSIVILGGGFGGLTAATELRKPLSSGHTITVVDKKPAFFMGLAKLWVLAGHRTSDVGKRDFSALEAKGIKFLQAEVTRINISNRTVATTLGDLPYDYLVIALGVDLAPESVPGFAAGAYNLYDLDGVVRLRDALRSFGGGTLLLTIFGLPFKCPPAPYEAMLLIDEILRQRGVRDKANLQVYTPEGQPLTIAGPAIGKNAKDLLAERGIGFNPGRRTKEVDARERAVVFDDDSRVHYDLLVGVPPHVAPRVVRESGLTGPGGWIPVDKRTLRTSFADVYAVGDVVSVMTANNLLLPKAGIFAEEEAKVVANNIAAEIQGLNGRKEFEGRGYCFMEVGGGKAALVEGEFLAEPAPKVLLLPATAENLERKREFEAMRLREWFGQF